MAVAVHAPIGSARPCDQRLVLGWKGGGRGRAGYVRDVQVASTTPRTSSWQQSAVPEEQSAVWRSSSSAGMAAAEVTATMVAMAAKNFILSGVGLLMGVVDDEME